MRKTDASNAKNQDTSHNTALTSDVMDVMNFDTSSWTALTEYLLQENQYHSTRHTEIATTDLALGTTGKTEKENTSPDHSLDTVNIIAPDVVTCTEDTPDHNRTGTTTIEAAKMIPFSTAKDAATGPAITHYTSHTTNPPHTATHQATTLRITVDCTHDHLTNCQSIVHTKKDHTVWDHTPARESKSPI